MPHLMVPLIIPTAVYLLIPFTLPLISVTGPSKSFWLLEMLVDAQLSTLIGNESVSKVTLHG
jgi:hypothetical protein